jgi:hypothetical protein
MTDRDPGQQRPERQPGRPRPASSAGDRSGGAERAPERGPVRGSGRSGRPDKAARPTQGGRPGSREGSAPARTGERRPRRVEPPLPDDVTGAELDRTVRAELASLASLNAQAVARHLVTAARLLDEDPDLAYQHAVAARERAGRVGAVREAAGLAAYRSGRFAEALSELRAARRITGDQSQLPVMADCERGLGRPERALTMAGSDEVQGLDVGGRVEMRIVASGARRDLGQADAAVLLLQGPQLKPELRRPWSARLFYAYAEALADAGRDDEAVQWLRHAAAADVDGSTDAAERVAAIDRLSAPGGAAADGQDGQGEGDGPDGRSPGRPLDPEDGVEFLEADS